MSELYSSGRIIDIVLILMALEAVALTIVRVHFGFGLPTGHLLITLASGAALMLAVRAALVGATWGVVSAFLLGGLVIHVTDLGLRWRSAGQTDGTSSVHRKDRINQS